MDDMRVPTTKVSMKDVVRVDMPVVPSRTVETAGAVVMPFGRVQEIPVSLAAAQERAAQRTYTLGV